MKMKRIFALLLCAMMLLTTIPVAASAYSGKPVIVSNPASLCWPEGGNAVWSCEVKGDDAHELEYWWYLIWQGQTYAINIVDEYASDAMTRWPWLAYVDLNAAMPAGILGNTMMLSGIGSELNGAEVYCCVYNGGYATESEHAKVMVGDSGTIAPPNIATPAFLTCTQGESVTLKCAVEPRAEGYSIDYIWYESSSSDLNGASAVNRGAETSASFKPNTDQPGLHYYFCGVFTGQGLNNSNISYSGVTVLEVVEKEEEQYYEVVIKTPPTKTVYEVGEKIDLYGMECRVSTSNGYLFIYNGDNMSVSPETAAEPGTQKIRVSYEGVSAEFNITVNTPVPSQPLIALQPVSAEYNMDEKPAALTVAAASAEGAELKYQWYYSTEPNGARHNIEGATKSAYTPNVEEGTKYYGCVITAVSAEGRESNPVWTDSASITFKAVIAEPDPEVEPENPTGDPTADPAGDPDPEPETDGSEDSDAGKDKDKDKDKDKNKDKDKDKDREEEEEPETRSGNGWLWAFIGAAILLVGAAAALTVLLLKRKDSDF